MQRIHLQSKIVIFADNMAREIHYTKRKALNINLNPAIYGTFAEIGAGQEVARNFFTAGAASGTIAKAISAYDMAFSDAIYGTETSGRYVSQSRVEKMLDHEYNLLLERLVGEKYTNRKFFAFANTVTTINFNKSNEPHGWVGLRFQAEAQGSFNDIVFHVRLLDSDVTAQQSVLGILGVNLIFGAYHYINEPQLLIESLVDNLSVGSVEIDLITVKGSAFKNVNNFLLNLYLIAKGFSFAAIFDANGTPCLPKELLYKRDIMILRSRFGQKSLPNFNLFNKAVDQFVETEKVNRENLSVLLEVLATNVLPTGEEDCEIELEKIAARADELCKTGNLVMVSNFSRNNMLARYLDRCKPKSVGISTNIANLKFIFNKENFGDHFKTQLLAYISDMFSRQLKLYAYPYLDKSSNQVITSKNVWVSEEVKPLYDFLVNNEYIQDIKDYKNEEVKTA